MQYIYLFIDKPELGEHEDECIDALSTFVSSNLPHATFINDRDPDSPSAGCEQSWRLGLETSIKAPKHLIEPLNGLYRLAKKYQCDFVVGLIEGKASTAPIYEDVCFFGNEEGKPDAFEMASYLGLE